MLPRRLFSEVGETGGFIGSRECSRAEGIIGRREERTDEASYEWMDDGMGAAGCDSSSSAESGKANW